MNGNTRSPEHAVDLFAIEQDVDRRKHVADPFADRYTSLTCKTFGDVFAERQRVLDSVQQLSMQVKLRTSLILAQISTLNKLLTAVDGSSREEGGGGKQVHSAKTASAAERDPLAGSEPSPDEAAAEDEEFPNSLLLQPKCYQIKPAQPPFFIDLQRFPWMKGHSTLPELDCGAILVDEPIQSIASFALQNVHQESFLVEHATPQQLAALPKFLRFVRPFVLDDDSASEDFDDEADQSSAPVAMDLEEEYCVDELLPEHPNTDDDEVVAGESSSLQQTAAATASERLRRTQRLLKYRSRAVMSVQSEIDANVTSSSNSNPHGAQPSLLALLSTYRTAFQSFEHTRQPRQKRRDPADYLVPFVPLEHPTATCAWTNFLNVLKEAAAGLPDSAPVHAVREVLGIKDAPANAIHFSDGLEQDSFTNIFDFHEFCGPRLCTGQQDTDEVAASCTVSKLSDEEEAAVIDISAYLLGSQKDVQPTPALATPRQPAGPSRSTKSCTVRAQRAQLKLQPSVEDGALAAQQPSSLPPEMQERFARGSSHETITFQSRGFASKRDFAALIFWADVHNQREHALADAERNGSSRPVVLQDDPQRQLCTAVSVRLHSDA